MIEDIAAILITMTVRRHHSPEGFPADGFLEDTNEFQKVSCPVQSSSAQFDKYYNRKNNAFEIRLQEGSTNWKQQSKN